MERQVLKTARRCRGSRCPRDGFTLVELLVVVAIICILAAVLLPVLVSARRRAREAPCLNNLRQIHIALMMYREDNGRLPSMLAEIVPGYAPKELLLCSEDAYVGYADAVSQAWPGGDDHGQSLWPSDPKAPTSYFYAPNFIHGDWWSFLSERNNAGYVVCALHGTPNPTAPTWLPAVYSGRTVRLRTDGSVTVGKCDPFVRTGPAGAFELRFQPLFYSDDEKGD